MADFRRLTDEIQLVAVIDLRSAIEVERQGIGLLSEANISYHSVPFMTNMSRADDERLFKQLSDMGDFYLHLVRRKEFGEQIIEALKIIAEPENYPLVFNCAVGKDRTGILAAFLLDLLGVEDKDIVEDYSLSGPYMVELLEQINQDPRTAQAVRSLPDYFWKAAPESMTLFLATLRGEYGSVEGYLEMQGLNSFLIERLQKALLV
jgi:protein-tyrosine phosphatase